MRNPNRSLAVAVATCTLFTSCATTHAPSGWLPSPRGLRSNAYGGWIEVESRQGPIRGEFIAVSEDTLFVADAATLHAVPFSDVKSIRLEISTSNAGLMAGWTLGSVGLLWLLTGFILGWDKDQSRALIFVGTPWFVVGSIATVAESHKPIISMDNEYIQKHRGEALRRLSPFARYPQGLPPDLDRNSIKMKK